MSIYWTCTGITGLAVVSGLAPTLGVAESRSGLTRHAPPIRSPCGRTRTPGQTMRPDMSHEAYPERSPVIGVENTPGFEMTDRALDRRTQPR